MKSIVVVYTSLGGLINTMKKEFLERMPEYRLVNIADDSLIKEVMENGKVTESVKKRMMHYFKAAAEWKPEVIVSACSSVGEVAEEAGKHLDVPIVRIDHAMIVKALEKGERIGVLASLATTMEPTVSYIQRLATAMNRNVKVLGKVAEGAYEANSRGETEVHDTLIAEAAKSIMNDVDVIILAQGSMAKMEGVLKEATGRPVFSSPRLCVEEVSTICRERCVS